MKLDRPMSSSACKGRSTPGLCGGANAAHAAATSTSSSSQNKQRSHTAPSPSQPPAVVSNTTFCDEDFFGGNFELADHFASANEEAEARVQQGGAGTGAERGREPPPPPGGGCPSSHQHNHIRHKRLHAVDLVKGIATQTQRKKGASSAQPPAAPSVNEATLRNLSLEEWGEPPESRTGEDWSRTVEALSLRGGSKSKKENKNKTPHGASSRTHTQRLQQGGGKSAEPSLPGMPSSKKQQKQQQQRQQQQLQPSSSCGHDEQEEQAPPPRPLDFSASSASKGAEDFLSIMSSITDVEL